MRGKWSNFSQIGNFSDLQVDISKTINRIEMNSSPLRSTFNFEQNDILFRHLNHIFIIYLFKKNTNLVFIGKYGVGQGQ